jgi:flagellar M-ring protein FliF
LFGIVIAGEIGAKFQLIFSGLNQALENQAIFSPFLETHFNRKTMADQASVLSDVRFQFQDFFGALSLTKRITILVALGIILIGMVSMIFVANRASWAPLYSNIELSDAAVIVEKLQEHQIPYMLAPGGRTIMVEPHRVDQSRLILAKEKVLPGSGVGFLDLFATPSLGETEFQQGVKFRVAQEGELARLISTINVVKSAKVSLAIPQKTLFSDNQVEPTAAIALNLTSSGAGRKQIETIIHLVASAVEGLTPRNVKITDQGGTLLSQGFSDDSAGGKMNDNYSYKSRLEKELEAKVVRQIEEVVGKDRVRVNVSANLRFDRRTIKEELVDPDQTSVVSEQIVDESSTGTRSIPVGPAGVTTNLPEATGREAATVSEFSKKNSTRNFESSRREVVLESAVGEVVSLSISVLLDNRRSQILDDSGNSLGRTNTPWTEGEKETIVGLVKAAIGYNESRGDRVFVGNMPFEAAVEEDKASEIEATRVRNKFILDVVRYVALGLAILALIMLVIRPMVQRLSSKPADLDLLMGMPATIGELEGEELEIPTERESGIPPRDKILEIAKQDPLKTSALIHTWLRDRS